MLLIIRKMLEITIPSKEYYDEEKNLFIETKEQTIRLEHSLVSLSKWESKWGKPFLSNVPKTSEESIDYIRCMTLTQNVDPNVYYAITNENIEEVAAYIESPMSATTINNRDKVTNREIVTAEIIYYWMIALKIPFECQKWHLNRLLTLIDVCSIKNNPQKKMSRSEILARNKALNEARKKQYNTRG